MTREEAIRKIDFCKRGYQKFADEYAGRGAVVGEGFDDEWDSHMPLEEAYKGMAEACNMAIKALEQEPKTGHWDRRACKCSECGYQITFSEYTEHKYKYCPNCGARMESEDKE